MGEPRDSMGGYAKNSEWPRLQELGASDTGWATSNSGYGQFTVGDTIGVKTNGEQGYFGWRGESRSCSRAGSRGDWDQNRIGLEVQPTVNPFYAYDNRYTSKASNAHHFASSRPSSRTLVQGGREPCCPPEQAQSSTIHCNQGMWQNTEDENEDPR